MPRINLQISDELHARLVEFVELSTGTTTMTTTLNMALFWFLEANPDGMPEHLQDEARAKSKRGRKPGRGSSTRATTTTPRPPAATTPSPATTLPAHLNPAAARAPGGVMDDGVTVVAETQAGPYVAKPADPKSRKHLAKDVPLSPAAQAFLERGLRMAQEEEEEDARAMAAERAEKAKRLEEARAAMLAARLAQIGSGTN